MGASKVRYILFGLPATLFIVNVGVLHLESNKRSSPVNIVSPMLTCKYLLVISLVIMDLL